MEEDIILALTALKTSEPLLANASISTKKLPPEMKNQPATQVVILKVSGSSTARAWQRNKGLLKSALILIHVYNKNTDTAEAVAYKVCELLESISTENIRYISINEEPRRIEYEGFETLIYANADVQL